MRTDGGAADAAPSEQLGTERVRLIGAALLRNPKVGAVLHVGQPSVQTLGIGDALFGAVVPAGRAIQTVYEAAYADAISIFDFNMRPGPSAWPRPDCAAPYDECMNGTNPGRTYRFYTGQPVVEFGFGLKMGRPAKEWIEVMKDAYVWFDFSSMPQPLASSSKKSAPLTNEMATPTVPPAGRRATPCAIAFSTSGCRMSLGTRA